MKDNDTPYNKFIYDDFINAQPALSSDGRCGAFSYDEVSAGTCTNTSNVSRNLDIDYLALKS